MDITDMRLLFVKTTAQIKKLYCSYLKKINFFLEK